MTLGQLGALLNGDVVHALASTGTREMASSLYIIVQRLPFMLAHWQHPCRDLR